MGGGGGGGGGGHFAPGSSLKGPPEYLFKDRYTLIEQSQYSSEEQCSKLIDKEIWLVRGNYCHCQQVMTSKIGASLVMTFFFFFFFWSSTYSLGEIVIQNGNLLASGAPLSLFALGPLISLGGPVSRQQC